MGITAHDNARWILSRAVQAPRAVVREATVNILEFYLFSIHILQVEHTYITAIIHGTNEFAAIALN